MPATALGRATARIIDKTAGKIIEGAIPKTRSTEFRMVWRPGVIEHLMRQASVSSVRGLAQYAGLPHQTLSLQVANNAPQMSTVAKLCGTFVIPPNALLEVRSVADR